MDDDKMSPSPSDVPDLPMSSSSSHSSNSAPAPTAGPSKLPLVTVGSHAPNPASSSSTERKGQSVRKRCDPCISVHRACVRPTAADPKDRPACERCQILGLECETSLRKRRTMLKPRAKSKKALALAAAAAAGDPVALETLHVKGTKKKSTSLLPSRPGPSNVQDLVNSSRENELRNSEMRGALMTHLISEAGGVYPQFFADANNDSIQPGFFWFLTLFHQEGQNPRGVSLGKYGEIKIALYCAIGAGTSKHSAILGSSTLQSANSTLTRRHLGVAREAVRTIMWRRCVSLWEMEKKTLLDDNTFEAFQVIFWIWSFNPDESSTRLMLRQATIEYWRRFCESPEKLSNPELRSSWFEKILNSDLSVSLRYNTLPVITEDDIRSSLVHPIIDARIYLNFPRSNEPPVPYGTTFDDHLQIHWGTTTAVQRMVAFGAPYIRSAKYETAKIVASRLLDTYRRRLDWRLGAFKEPDAPVKSMEEEPYLFRIWETVSRASNIFHLLRSLVDRMNKEDSDLLEQDEEIWELWKDLAGLSNEILPEILTYLQDPQIHSGSNIRRSIIVVLQGLPGGVRYLVYQYLLGGCSAEEMTGRAAKVKAVLDTLHHLAHDGRPWTVRLSEIEDGIRHLRVAMSTNAVGPFLTAGTGISLLGKIAGFEIYPHPERRASPDYNSYLDNYSIPSPSVSPSRGFLSSQERVKHEVRPEEESSRIRENPDGDNVPFSISTKHPSKSYLDALLRTDEVDIAQKMTLVAAWEVSEDMVR